MGNAQKMMIAVACVFAIGFIMVGSNKDQTDEQKEAASMVRAMANLQRIAHDLCPKLIKENTGSAVMSLVSKTSTDKSTYLTLEWLGEKNDNFNKAVCTVDVTKGGVSKLVIDDKTVVDKDAK